MFARFASDAFSRAMSCDPLGRSMAKIVNARPVERNVPDVSVVRSKERLEQLATEAPSRAASTVDRRNPRVRRTAMSEP